MIGIIGAMQPEVESLVQALDHIDEFHHRSAVLQDTAVDILAVLDLEIPAGAEGQGGQARDGYLQLDLFTVQGSAVAECMGIQLDGPLPYLAEFMFFIIDHM